MSNTNVMTIFKWVWYIITGWRYHQHSCRKTSKCCWWVPSAVPKCFWAMWRTWYWSSNTAFNCKTATSWQCTSLEYSTPEEYFRFTLYIPYIEMLQSELTELFARHQHKCLQLQHLVPHFIKSANFANIQSVVHIYSKDLSGSESVVKGEFERWKKKCENVDIIDCPKNAVQALEKCSHNFFPNVRTLIKIFAVLPVTTCSCERSFSCLRRLKTYLRSTMKEERLNGLAHLAINRHVSVNPDNIIDIFARSPRRLDFTL